MLILLLNVTEAIKNAVHLISLVRVGHFPLQGFQFVVEIADASAPCDRFIQDRTALHFLDVLAKVADRQLLGDRDRALVGSFLAHHHSEEGCLARAIGTDQSDFFARIQLKGSIHEKQLLAILLIDVRERDHLKEQPAARASSSVARPENCQATQTNEGTIESACCLLSGRWKK